MLRIKYSREASNYFFDNSSLVFDLQMAVEGLVFSKGIPAKGTHYVSPGGTHVWGILNHTVLYRIESSILYVYNVMPN